jgi:hypothetical protein
MRHPRHPASLFDIQSRFMRPFAAQPMRPGETLTHVDLFGELWHNSLVNLALAPMCYFQVGLWFVPLSAYGPGFKALFTTDAEDIAQRGAAGADLAGTAGDATFPAGTSQQRLTTAGYQQVPRQWAGEIGNTGDLPSSYVPWVSHGSYIIADNYYGLDTTLDFRDTNLLQNPPFVEPYIRGATIMGHDLSTGGIDPDPSAETSLTQMLESLYLLQTPTRSFNEILQGFGVDPRDAEGMPVPIMVEDYILESEIAGPLYGVSDTVVDAAEDEGVAAGWGASNFGGVPTTSAVDGLVYSVRPMGYLRKKIGARRSRMVTADTFGMLIGTVTPFVVNGTQGDFGHMFDATRMLNLGHWGDPSFGGIDEIDFMTVQDLYARDAVTETGGQEAFNLLNLFLHGDVFTEHAQNSVDAFAFRGPGGDPFSNANVNFTVKLSAGWHIRTDLVGS